MSVKSGWELSRTSTNAEYFNQLCKEKGCSNLGELRGRAVSYIQDLEKQVWADPSRMCELRGAELELQDIDSCIASANKLLEQAESSFNTARAAHETAKKGTDQKEVEKTKAALDKAIAVYKAKYSEANPYDDGQKVIGRATAACKSAEKAVEIAREVEKDAEADAEDSFKTWTQGRYRGSRIAGDEAFRTAEIHKDAEEALENAENQLEIARKTLEKVTLIFGTK